MALQVNTPTMTQEQVDCQQHEYDKAYADNNNGRYIIVDDGGAYDLCDHMKKLIREHHPEYTEEFPDEYELLPEMDLYSMVVNIFIDISIGNICSPPIDISRKVTLIWVRTNIYDTWSYQDSEYYEEALSSIGIGKNKLYLL